MQWDWQPLNPLDGWIYLKFSCYEDYLEVYVNENIVNMQVGYDATPYGYGRNVPGDPLPAGGVSLCSFGGVHEFDEVRIQNECPYDERDVLDCIRGLMEKYRIEPGVSTSPGIPRAAWGPTSWACITPTSPPP